MKGEQLIFLISQPRSGSSLLQQLILNSNEISSTPESWQMLSLIHTYKSTSINHGYNPKYTSINFLEYLNTIENGLDLFKQKIKTLALKLYAFKEDDSSYFLDKTPRYYHIIEELYELFPKAKFIFLVRNPLSVFASMLDYNFNGKYFKFLSAPDRIDDLFLAPNEICKFVKFHDNHILVKYEKLVKNPDKELRKIFNYLSLDLPKNASNYFVDEVFRLTNSIDTKSLTKNNKPTDEYLDSWKKILDTSQKKKLAIGFLNELQTKHSDYFDYNLDLILKDLQKHKPQKKYLLNLSYDLISKSDVELGLFKLIKKRLILKFQRQ